jgi:hypothetical protein
VRARRRARETGGGRAARVAAYSRATRATPRSRSPAAATSNRRRNKRFALKGTRKAGQRTKALAANAAAKKAQA